MWVRIKLYKHWIVHLIDRMSQVEIRVFVTWRQTERERFFKYQWWVSPLNSLVERSLKNRFFSHQKARTIYWSVRLFLTLKWPNRLLTHFVRESVAVWLNSCLTGLDFTKQVNLFLIQHKQSSRIHTVVWIQMLCLRWIRNRFTCFVKSKPV